MKTTIEISEPLLHEAKKLAAEERTTLRSLVEEGLRRVLEEHRNAEPYLLEDFSVGGTGLTEEAKAMTWEEIIHDSYGDRL